MRYLISSFTLINRPAIELKDYQTALSKLGKAVDSRLPSFQAKIHRPEAFHVVLLFMAVLSLKGKAVSIMRLTATSLQRRGLKTTLQTLTKVPLLVLV